MEVYWVRHGKTEYNLLRKIQGWCDSPLLENDDSFERAASKLKGIEFDYVCSSDLKRAYVTLENILNIIDKDRKYNTYKHKEFREVGFGKWEEMEIDRVAEEYKELWGQYKSRDKNYDPSEIGAENFDQIFGRVYRKLDELKKEYGDNAKILIVAHGGLIAIINHFKEVVENGEVVVQKY